MGIFTVIWSWIMTRFDMLERLVLLPTQEVSHLILLTIVLLYMFPVMALWTDRRGVSGWLVAFASLSVPAALCIMLIAPAGYRGEPDDNCAKYDGGKLVFSLIGLVALPRDSHTLIGDEDLVLIVQAESRWGSAPHQCRLPLSDIRTKNLRDLIEAAQDGDARGRMSRGVVTFTFGNKNEQPNVKIKKLAPPGKNSPPEAKSDA